MKHLIPLASNLSWYHDNRPLATPNFRKFNANVHRHRHTAQNQILSCKCVPSVSSRAPRVEHVSAYSLQAVTDKMSVLFQRYRNITTQGHSHLMTLLSLTP